MKEELIVKRFENQVAISPESLAVSCGQLSISYDQLNRRVNLLANYLIEKGVKKNSFVAVILPRSIDFIVAVLAVLKSGGCYIPIDPGYPEERIRNIIADAGVFFLLKNNSNALLLDDDELCFVNVDTFDQLIKSPMIGNPLSINDMDDPIYIIYTSGSTGIPKGAINKHNGFLNLIDWYTQDFNLNKNDKILIYTPLNFDLTQKNIFAPLLVGATIFLVNDGLYDPSLIADEIYRNKITWINSTPSAFYPLIESDYNLKKLESLRYVFVGGEPLFAKRVLSIHLSNPRLKIVNTYGPTECADVCSFYTLTEKDFKSQHVYVPIGKQIKNMNLYVLDDNMNKVKEGEIGELYVEGVGVGLGYINNKEITNQAFLPNPFDKGNNSSIYKTGDIVRILPDSNLEFIERKDFQVKIRGYRVELEEIISSLRTIPGVKDALVIAYENQDQEKFLVGYAVGKSLKETDLKKNLQEKLPAYMVPSAIIVMDAFPLTANGKVDRKKLALIKNKDSHSLLKFSLDDRAKKMFDIWEKFLPVSINNLEDSFFSLGGHSLSAVKILFQIKKEFGVEISIQELFTHPTIFSLLRVIDEKKTKKHRKIKGIMKNATGNKSPLSLPHQRIFYIENTFHNPIIFNNLITLSLKGLLSEKKLENAFRELIERHEIFRTCIVREKDKIFEKIFDNLDFTLEKIDFSQDNTAAQKQKVEEFARQVVEKPFNLMSLPLIRGFLIKLGEGSYVLVMCLHQFLIDGASMHTFYKELSAFYNGDGESLEELKIQYKDYAFWQSQMITKKNIQDQINFWKMELKNAPEQIHLKTDFSRGEEFSYRGDVYTLNLGEELSVTSNKFCQKNDVTLFMLLMSIYSILLTRYTKNRDIVIGAPIANRRSADLDPLIGFFVNLVPYRVQFLKEITFLELILNIKKIALDAYDNQDIPFVHLPEYLNIKKRKDYHPIFQVVFAMQPYAVDKFCLDEVQVKDLDYEEPIAKFDMALNASLKNGNIELKFEYATDLFVKKSVEKMAEEFKSILEECLSKPEKKLTFPNIDQGGKNG